MTQEELIEQLAEKEHEHWRFWMTLFLNRLEQQPDGSLIIPSERVEVYRKLTQTFYKELQERDKKPYLNAVGELLPIIGKYVGGKLWRNNESLAETLARQLKKEIDVFTIGLHATSLLLWGIVLHLFIDWILQNDWQAQNKSDILHPAAYVHSGLHLLGLLLVFPAWMAGIIAIIHLLIDTRVPLQFWRKIYRQTTTGDVALHVAMWGDQVLHISVLAVAA